MNRRNLTPARATAPAIVWALLPALLLGLSTPTLHAAQEKQTPPPEVQGPQIPPAAAPEPGGAIIREVQIEGLSTTTPALAADIVKLEPGQPFNAAEAEAAVNRLLQTGRFLAAEYDTEEVAGGVRLVFRVKERTVVTDIRFEGNEHFREGKLKKELDQKEGQPANLFAIRDAQQSIAQMYREDGFGKVTVSYDEDLLLRTGELVFTINEGVRVRVREIVFQGNQTLESSQLKKQLDTKTAWWFIRSGAFGQDKVEADVGRVQNYCRDEGFLDCTVNYRTDVNVEGDMILTFVVEEGTRYRIENIAFNGNTALTESELRTLIKSAEGEIVKRPQVDKDAQAVHTRYGELGYIYASVRPVRVFSQEPGLVRITLEIEEGEQFRVGRVVVRGNTRTRDKVIRRALNLYPPDDLFNLPEAREAEKRLLDTRIFSSAKVIPVGEEPGVRDAVIDVQEAQKAGDFLFGAGITSNSGIVGSIVLDLQNFDLFDPPRTLAEFYKLRAFYGGGQRLRLEAQPGTEVNRYRLDFTEPYFFDRPIRFDAGAYLFARARDGWDEERMGGVFSFGKRFEQGRFRGWSGEIAFRAEQVTVDDVDLFTSSEVRDDEGDNLLTSVKGSLVRDRTDNRFLPSTGDRFSASYEQFVGDHMFGQLNFGYDWYTTLSTDRLERKHVLKISGETGWIVGDAPVFERYFAGGVGSMRGFDYRGVGERDGIDDTNIGGDYLILLGTEYSYPLYGEKLRGHIFLDTGTAGSGTYRAAVGTGIRITLDILRRPVPIELNLAMPLARDGDDEEQIFSFVIGSIF